MNVRRFSFTASGSYRGGHWELGGELDTNPEADFVDGISAILTTMIQALLEEYPDGRPFHITKLTIEQVTERETMQ